MSHGPARSDVEARAIRAWRGRVLAGLFLGGFADALALLCGGAAAILLLLRVFQVTVDPSPAWAAALVLPVAFGGWRARRGRPTDLECAVPLDRRLGLSGWLLTGFETSTKAWTESAGTGLDPRQVRAALPRVRVARLLARSLPAAALLGGVLLLPPPAADAAPVNPAVLEALRRVEERLDALSVEPKLEERAPDPLRDRVEELRREAEKGKNVAWADVDAVAERLERKTEERAAALEKARSALSQATATSPGAHDGATKSEQMAAGLDAALEAGLLPTLSPELAKALEAAGVTPGEKIDPAALGLDAATLERIAKALEATAGQQLSELAKAGLIDPQRLAALERLLASDPKANPFRKGDRLCRKCHGKRPEGCGT